MNIGLADKNNRWALIIFGTSAGLVGSAVTVIAAGSALWAIVSVLGKRFRLSLDRPTIILAAVALAYVIAGVMSAMINLPGSPMSFGKTIAKLAPLALFITPLFLVSRLRLSKPEDLLSAFVFGAACYGLLALPFAAYQVFYLGQRAEGGAGNAIPFAMLCAFFSVISLLNGEYPQVWRKVLGWAGFACATFAVFLSQTKGVAPIPLIGAFVYLAAFQARNLGLARIGLLLLVICLAMFGALYVSGAFNRLAGATALLSGEMPAVDDGSYAPRIMLWKAAVQLFAEHPVFGSGPQHIRSLVEATGATYSHFHNGYLTVAVGSGAVGLITLLALLLTPLALSFRARRMLGGAPRLYISFILVFTYMIGGTSNFIFGHDIYDSLFLFTASLCIASIGDAGVERGDSQDQSS